MRKFKVNEVMDAIGSGPEATPLAFLMTIMHLKEAKMSDRIQCAIAAAPYVHPRLSSIEMKGDKENPLQIQTDIGQALKALAEIARTREAIDVTPEPTLLEAGSL